MKEKKTELRCSLVDTIITHTYVQPDLIISPIYHLWIRPVGESYLVPPTFNWMISPIPRVKLVLFVAMMETRTQRFWYGSAR